MKIKVNPHNVEIVREQTEPINELEVKVSKCEFEFDEKITNEFVKEAYFTLNGSTYMQIIINNECDYPNEVLTEKGTLEIGVVAYKAENEEEIIRYNPSPDYYDTWEGSLKDAENTEPLTPTDKEQMQSQISQNTSDISDLQANKQDKLTQGDNITIDENNVISAVDTIYDDTEIKADIQDLQETKIDKDVNNLTYYTLTTETGSKIKLSIDSSTYVMTLKLKDKNNNDISTDSVDLPLETMVVGARYDSATKEIVLTLKNGQEVRFSVADLVSGLQTEITENNKLSSDLVDDTNNTNKFVSASEKAQITTNKNDITAIKDGEEIDSFADVENAFDGVDTALGLKEDKSNKVTEINSSSTDTEYPSAKCVYNSQEEQNEHIAELEMLYNAFPTVSDEDTTIQLDNTAKVKFREIDLKGNTIQVVIPEEQGTSVSNTSIYVSDVNTDKEHTIEMSGNTYQATSILPSEYTQVDYIESHGTEYIDTNVFPYKTTVEYTFAYNNFTTGTYRRFVAIFDATSSPTLRYYSCQQSGETPNILVCTTYNNIAYELGNADTNKHTIIFNDSNGNVYFDGVLKATSENFDLPRQSANNLSIFATGGATGTSKIAGKLWNLKIYDKENNNELVRDFIPCYRNSDNEVGLYDIVNNIFYTNRGTGAFTYGAVVSIPNPSYPQNIEVVTGTQNVEVCGKNLFNVIDFENDLVSGKIKNDNGIEVSDSTSQYSKYFIPVIANQPYYFDGYFQRIYLYNSNKEWVGRVIGSSGTSRMNTSYTPTINGYIQIQIHTSTYNSNKGTEIISLGSTATTYEAYTGTTYPVNLGNIELCKISTYQDRIYKSNNKWYLEKKVGKVVLDGTQDIYKVATGTTGYYRYNVDIGTNIFTTDSISTVAPFYCNRLVSGTRGNTFSIIECIAPTTTNYSYKSFNLYIEAISQMTVEQVNTWFSNNNTIVYYPYATPTTTEITDTNLVNQLNALYNATIYPITNINTETSNLLPYIDLHYNFVTPSPSPSRPSVVNVVKGNNTITISNSDNTESQNYPINLGDIELCKISTYQDYIYESNGNWFKKSNINKVTFNGSEENWARGTIQDYYRYTLSLDTLVSADAVLIYSNYYRGISYNNRNSDYFNTIYANGNIGINTDVASTLTEWKSWLSNNNLTAYYVLATPTDTQITDTTLITQLDNIKKAYSYDTQTNISQTNTDKPFIIYAEAIRSLKDVFE